MCALSCDEWSLRPDDERFALAEAAAAARGAAAEAAGVAAGDAAAMEGLVEPLCFEDVALAAALLKSHGSVRSLSVGGLEAGVDGGAGGGGGVAAAAALGQRGKQLLADALLSSIVCRVEAVEADGWALAPGQRALEIGDVEGGQAGAKGGGGEFEFGDADAALLAAALKAGNRRLRRLALRAPRCRVGESGARDLSEALATNGALRHLDLSGNAIGVAGVDAIAKAVGGGGGGGGGGGSGGSGGAAAAPGSAAARPSSPSSLLQSASLTSSCRLVSLTLRGVGAGPECGATLGAALVASGSLRRLELSHNALADSGVVDLVGALRRDRSFAVRPFARHDLSFLVVYLLTHSLAHSLLLYFSPHSLTHSLTHSLILYLLHTRSTTSGSSTTASATAAARRSRRSCLACASAASRATPSMAARPRRCVRARRAARR